MITNREHPKETVFLQHDSDRKSHSFGRDH